MTASTIVGAADAPSAGSTGARAPYTPTTLLKALDGWLAEAGHGDDDRWRVSIATTLAAHRAQRIREMSGCEELADDAFNLAAVLRAIGARAATGNPEHTIASEEHRVELARALRVAFNLADALGSKAADLAEVAHG